MIRAGTGWMNADWGEYGSGVSFEANGRLSKPKYA